MSEICEVDSDDPHTLGGELTWAAPGEKTIGLLGGGCNYEIPELGVDSVKVDLDDLRSCLVECKSSISELNYSS